MPLSVFNALRARFQFSLHACYHSEYFAFETGLVIINLIFDDSHDFYLLSFRIFDEKCPLEFTCHYSENVKLEQ